MFTSILTPWLAGAGFMGKGVILAPGGFGQARSQEEASEGIRKNGLKQQVLFLEAASHLA